MNKRFLALVLVIGLLSTAAFGGTVFASEEEPLKLNFYYNSVNPIPPDALMIQHWNDYFNVDISVTLGEDMTSLNLLLAGNEIPDIFFVPLADLAKYREQQAIAEIPEERVKEYMPIYYDLAEQLVPGFFKYLKLDGKLYALLGEMNTPYRGTIVYRGDWIEKLGKAMPTTLDEFEDLMYAFADDPDNTGKETYGLSNTAFAAVYGAFGFPLAQWRERDGQIVYSNVQPEIKEALGYLQKWYADGVIDPEFITGENKGGYWANSNAFIEGRIGTSSHGAYYHWAWFPGAQNYTNYTEMKEVNPKAAESFVFGVPLSTAKGPGVLGQGAPFNTGVVVFGQQLEDEPEKMIKLMEMQELFCTDQTIGTTAMLGFEGVHWAYDDLEVPVFIGADNRDYNFLVTIGAHTVIMRMWPVRAFEWRDGPATNRWLAENGYFEGGASSVLYTPLPSGGTYWTELNKLWDETQIAIVTGEQPLDYFDDFVTRWMAEGGEILTSEANAAYASFN